MNQKQELARVIESAILGRTATDGAHEAADKIFAAGYRKVRIIETVEELNELPLDSKVLDADFNVISKDGAYRGYLWWIEASQGVCLTEDVVLPVIVLYDPGA